MMKEVDDLRKERMLEIAGRYGRSDGGRFVFSNPDKLVEFGIFLVESALDAKEVFESISDVLSEESEEDKDISARMSSDDAINRYVSRKLFQYVQRAIVEFERMIDPFVLDSNRYRWLLKEGWIDLGAGIEPSDEIIDAMIITSPYGEAWQEAMKSK